jgi:hypothetical protein
MRMQGRARDLLTPLAGEAVVLDEAATDIMASQIRQIESIAVTPEREAAQRLVGVRAGGQSRIMLAEILPEDCAGGTPLRLLLDDFAGASLVAGWAWSRWVDDWATLMRQNKARATAGRGGVMEGICTGFAPGSSALKPDGTSESKNQNNSPVVSLVNPDDPIGWHPLGEQEGVGMRRARRLDLWREGDLLMVEIGFQDSATSPAGGRVAIHEYEVSATVDVATLTLRTLKPDPRILPFPECPGAVANAGRMVGKPVAGFRTEVLETLPGTLGCTHLNDVLRSMGDIPALMRAL